MSLLGDDGRGYELACKLESCNVWRTWLGDSNYASFVQFLSSPSSWDSFMSSDDSKSRAEIHLQLRARALLFDKASVSIFLCPDSNSTSSSSSLAVSNLNPNYLQLHADDVYFSLESSLPEGGQGQHREASKIQSKAAFGYQLRYGEFEIDNKLQRCKNEELPDTWYNQFSERHRGSKQFRLSSADRESEKRIPDEMSAYIKLAMKHKKRCLAFKEDPSAGYGYPIQVNSSHMNPNSALGGIDPTDHDVTFFPETMFAFNCVPDSALPQMSTVQDDKKVEFCGVLDTLPQVMTRSPVMLERLGIRPEYLSLEGGALNRGKNGSAANKSSLSQEQAAQLSQKVVARMLTNVGFEGSSEVPIEVFSRLLSCHIRKLGDSLRVLSDSYRKQCSAIELLKMFLQTVGYSNFGPLADQVKHGSRNFHQQSQQQIHGMQSQLQPQHQNPVRLPQQVSRQMHPQLQLQQMQQLAQSKNIPFQQQQLQQQQQIERMRRRQPSTPRAGMDIVQDRPMVQVKIEAPSETPMDSNTYNNFNNRHPQMQFRQQQMPAMSNPTMQNVTPQSVNQFRQMSSSQIAQIQTQNASVLRARPVKVEGFQELMGGDASSKHDSEDNRLTSPK